MCHCDSLFECVYTLMAKLFTRDYLLSHSVCGQKANILTPAKQKFDGRLYSAMTSIVKAKFVTVKKTEITQRVHAVCKKYAIKNK